MDRGSRCTGRRRSDHLVRRWPAPAPEPAARSCPVSRAADAAAAEPVPTAPATLAPTPPPPTRTGLVTVDSLSFPRLGDPWERPPTTTGCPSGRWRSMQSVLDQANYDGEATTTGWPASWSATSTSATASPARSQGAEIVLKCVLGTYYADTVVTQNRGSAAQGHDVDGHDGWLIETQLSFSIPNLNGDRRTRPAAGGADRAPTSTACSTPRCPTPVPTGSPTRDRRWPTFAWTPESLALPEPARTSDVKALEPASAGSRATEALLQPEHPRSGLDEPARRTFSSFAALALMPFTMAAVNAGSALITRSPPAARNRSARCPRRHCAYARPPRRGRR